MNGGPLGPRPVHVPKLAEFALRYDRECDAWAELGERARELLFEELLELYRDLYERITNVAHNTQMTDADRIEALRWIPANYPNLTAR